MPARSAIRLFSFRGIAVGVDYTWFFVLFLVIFSLSGFYRDVLGGQQEDVGPYLLAVVSALAFFGSIVLHELGHAVVALREGIPITEITLWLFGGVARMGRDTDSPGAEFRIAVAGPVVTLAIAALCLGAGFAIGGQDEFWASMRFEESTDASGALAVLAWVATINIFVLGFNLIPAFPLDGGRIARAVAWRITGNRARATRFAATLGQGFAYLFVAVGILLVFNGSVVGGIWLGVIGFILGSAARGAVAQTELASRIEGLTVADVMDADPVAIPQDASVERALDEFFLRYRWPWFPVVDPAHRYLGLLQRGAADAVPVGRRETARVAEFLTSDRDGGLEVPLDAPIESLLGNENLRRLGGLAAVDTDGTLRGVVTAEQVGRALRNAFADG